MLSPIAQAADLPAGCLARLGDARFRHPGPVSSLAFAPDGKTLISHADGDRVARVWAIPSGEFVVKVSEPRFTRDITRVIGFAAGGKHLIVMNDDDEAITIELGVVQKEVARWSARQVEALSRDGALAAGADTQGRAAVWRTNTGEKVLAIGNVPERKKLAAAFDPDGTRVAFAGHDAGAVQVYPLGRPGQPVTVPTVGTPTQLDWPAADRLLVRIFLTDGPSQLTVLDPTTGKFGRTASDHPGPAVLFPGGVRRAAVSADTLLAEELVPTPRLQWSDARRGTGVKGLAVSADGKLLATAVGTSVRLFDTDTGLPLRADGVGVQAADHLAISADGRRVLAAGGSAVTLWDVDAGQPLHTWTALSDRTGEFTSAVLSPGGRYAAAAAVGPGSLSVTFVWDTRTGRELFRETAEDRRTALGFDTEERLWIGAANAQQVVRAVSPASGEKVVVPQPLPTSASSAGSLSAGGRWAVVRGPHAVGVRPTAGGTWQLLRPDGDYFHGPVDGPNAVSPTGTHAALAWDRGLLGWPVRGPGRPVAVRDLLPAANDRIQGLGFTADGRMLGWTKANDTAVRFWDVHVWAERYRFEPPGGVRAFGFSADGRRTVIAHPDGTLSVWDSRAVEDRSLPLDEAFADGELWDRLGSPDARVGLVAVRTLARRPGAAKLLAARMPVVDADTVTRLVSDLDSPAYPVRESASRKLSALGEVAEGAVRRALASHLSPEVRTRAAAILKQYQTADGRLPPVLLRAARAVEVLERVGGPEAEAVLRRWAAGERTSLRATEAAAALGRMGR